MLKNLIIFHIWSKLSWWRKQNNLSRVLECYYWLLNHAPAKWYILKVSRVWFDANADSKIPYARHYNPLLIINRWILTVHKVRILRKKDPYKTFLAIKNGVQSIQTAGYNGACTVCELLWNPPKNVIFFSKPYSQLSL